jgi:enterochelin esterase-like enzyme
MKVIVGGCSVSDYTGPEVKKVYGEILANNINAEYIHHGAGCGSNYRIWRTITRMVMNNEIDKDDIVFIQYTDVSRQEYWSSYILSEDNRFDQYRKIELR